MTPVRVAAPQRHGKAVAFHVRDLPFPAQEEEQLVLPPPTTTYSGLSKDDMHEESSSDRLRVVLDLDECLVHCRIFSSPLDAAIYAHSRRNNDFFRTYLPGGAHVHVGLRPGLLDFLRQCTGQYDTYIFTASLPDYANPILDHLCAAVRQGTAAAPGIFRGRFYRHHCTLDPLQNQYIKDLSTLPKQLSSHLHRTVLVDNNPFSFLKQPENGILVDSFFNEASRDGEPPFSQLLQQFQELSQVPDVRSILNAAAPSLDPPPELLLDCQMAVAM